ncbi:AAA family ATPase [Microlunatus elymi]|uniref:AAA family ATPase n=1 Tax=Microlunatus elymi TaxID=2596828 RepID=A0A516PUM9_9ACTN|nr:LuxR family transcriptional regulator [Microlunatus elymi]QDP94906.1 AAA family ATPase [Microlunatus elymi]
MGQIVALPAAYRDRMDSPFVGRESELQRMQDLLSPAMLQRGHVLIVRGEAGIGKTRLTEEFARLAAGSGVQVIRGQALDDPGMPVLWPWRQPLSDLGGAELIEDAPSIELTDSSDAANARFRFFSRITDLLLRRAQAPRLLVMEDLHWADELSLALLRHVVAAVRNSPMILVLTVRDLGPRPWAQPVEQTLTDLLALPATHVIRLPGLPRDQVRRWLAGLHGVPAEVAGRVAESITDADGANPLHVRLLSEALIRRPDASEPDAPDLRRLVLAQLADLPVRVQRTIRAASIFNDRVRPDLLAKIVQLPLADVLDDLDHAVRAGVLRRNRDDLNCEFMHVLVRDAVRVDLGPDEREQLHHRTAMTLAELTCADKFAGLIARHWLLSGRREADREALHWLRRAATVASAGQDLITAVDVWGQALAAAERLGWDEVRGWLHIDRARARYCAGRINESLADCAAAVDLAGTVKSPEMAARAALVVAGVGSETTAATIESLCTQALSMMPQQPDRTQRLLTARTLARRAHALAYRDLPAARGLSRTAVELVDDGCADAVLDAVAARHLTLCDAQHVEPRIALAERAIAVGPAAHQPLGRAWGHIWMYEAAMQRGDLGRVDGELAALSRVVNADGWPMTRWHLLRATVCRAVLVGDFGTAERVAADAGRLAIELGDPSIPNLPGEISAELGILRGGMSAQTLGRTLEQLGARRSDGPAAELLMVRLLLAAADHDQAIAAYRGWRQLIMNDVEPADRPGRQGQLLAHAQIATELGDQRLAQRLYPLVLAERGPYRGDGSPLIFSTGSLARHAAELAAVLGRTDEAISLHQQGIRENLLIGATPFVALGRLGLARVLLSAPGRERPDNGEVRGLLAAAAATFDELGMTGRLDEIRRLQGHPLPRTVIGLTPREVEVARMVAEAQTNRDIAQRLVLSERTVESHVRNALAKIGADSRTGLATWMLRHHS